MPTDKPDNLDAMDITKGRNLVHVRTNKDRGVQKLTSSSPRHTAHTHSHTYTHTHTPQHIVHMHTYAHMYSYTHMLEITGDR